MKRRDFIKNAAAFASVTLLPSSVWATIKNGKLRTAHIGVGGMGFSDLQSIASHPMVEVTAFCDVDSNNLAEAKKLYPNAKLYADYRKLFDEMGNSIDAVIVSTPDHTHAPASMMAMNMGKPVYCQKPLTHHVSEARAMRKLSRDNKLITQMGIQCHSSDEYRKAVMLIQSGIIGKVSCVRAWSPKNWGYDGPAPVGSDPVPENLDWNLWLGTSPDRSLRTRAWSSSRFPSSSSITSRSSTRCIQSFATPSRISTSTRSSRSPPARTFGPRSTNWTRCTCTRT